MRNMTKNPKFTAAFLKAREALNKARAAQDAANNKLTVEKARLIAAAPDLLAALKELVDVVGGDFHALDKARAVIAKAEGRRSS